MWIHKHSITALPNRLITSTTVAFILLKKSSFKSSGRERWLVVICMFCDQRLTSQRRCDEAIHYGSLRRPDFPGVSKIRQSAMSHCLSFYSNHVSSRLKYVLKVKVFPLESFACQSQLGLRTNYLHEDDLITICKASLLRFECSFMSFSLGNVSIVLLYERKRRGYNMAI